MGSTENTEKYEKPEKLDRRVQRTRALLRAALLELIVEQGYDSIRLQDITDRANLRRATFYKHYSDKEELLLSALSENFGVLVRESQHVAQRDSLGGKTQVEAYRVTFQHAAQNHALYRNILGSQSGALFARRIREYLAILVMQGLNTIPPDELSIPVDVLANYIAGTELSMITWWLENNMPYPVQQMAEIVHRLMLNGINGVMRKPEKED
jgi:AcrR family transcriptional regulator